MRACAVAAVFALLAVLCVSPAAAIKNAQVKRTIDLTSSLAREEIVVDLSEGPASQFDVAVRAENVSSIGDLSVVQRISGKDVPLKLIATEDSRSDDVAIKLYRFKLAEDLKDFNTVNVVIRIVYIGALKPFPESISSMRENQLVTFFGNVHFFSPYATTKESLTVKLASNSIESHSPKGTASKDTITYDTKENVAPYSHRLFSVHYQNNSPFIVTGRVHRIITLTSNNVNVEEHYWIKHAGAELTGIFSRLEFQYGGAATAVRGVRAVIPGSSHNIYFRDQIGNISTSTLEDKDDDILVTLNQRFPLFGGWKTNFYWGYDVPASEYVKAAGRGSVAHIPLAAPLLDMHVKEMTVELIFPTGSSDIKVSIDGVEQTTESRSTPVPLEFSGGKPTRIFTVKNVVSASSKTIEANYVAGSGSLLKYILYPGIAAAILYVLVNAASADDAAASRKRH